MRFLAGLACGVLLLSNGYGGSNQITSQGQLKRWKAGTTIPYAVNPGGVPGFVSQSQQLVVAGAVNDAFRAWREIPGAAIAFVNTGTTSQTNAAQDGTNLVTFQDSAFQFAPGVLAAALVASAIAPGPTQLPNGQVVTAEFAGQILDADIVFNTKATTFSPLGASNAADLVAIGIHEVGHLLGLDHSGIFSSIMYPFGESGGGGASRTVQSDDAITAAVLYPASTFAASTGTISGTITSSTGSPVKSAHAVAVNAAGAPVASQMSDADGKYAIAGLPPGSYQVMVEPQDGPISLANYEFYSNGQNNFATTFLGGSSSPTTVSVVAGQTAPANVAVPAKSASTLNMDNVILVTEPQPGQLLFQPEFALYLPRGKSYQVGAIGSNLGTDSNLAFTAPGITAQATTGGTLTDGRTFRRANISMNAAAAPGPSNLLLTNPSSTSAALGGVVTTVNPAMATPIRDNAGFGTTLAPGAMIAIFGADLAPTLVTDAAAIPIPTTMGGISVKIGDRYAPLFFTTPGIPNVQPSQIVTMVPWEVTGSTAQVTVVTGPKAAGNTVTVNLSPTAPGIFTANSSGAGQGIIQNGADPGYAAPVGAYPFPTPSHPAKPGDTVVIWASGLGPVTPSIPTGLTPGVNGLPFSSCEGTKQFCMVNLPRVLIGGQQATVVFAGLQSGNVAIYQVNVVVPPSTAASSAVPVQIITFEGQTSNTVTMTVSP